VLNQDGTRTSVDETIPCQELARGDAVFLGDDITLIA
jgi:hypothetical protein